MKHIKIKVEDEEQLQRIFKLVGDNLISIERGRDKALQSVDVMASDQEIAELRKVGYFIDEIVQDFDDNPVHEQISKENRFKAKLDELKKKNKKE